MTEGVWLLSTNLRQTYKAQETSKKYTVKTKEYEYRQGKPTEGRRKSVWNDIRVGRNNNSDEDFLGN